MSILLHVLLTLVILFGVCSYVLMTFTLFFKGEEMKATNFFARLLFWVIAPIVVLAFIGGKLFERKPQL